MADENTNEGVELPEGVTIAAPHEGVTVTAEEARAAQEKPKLAGKFDSAEELEKAYEELQKKLGQPKETTEETPEGEAEEEAEDKPKEGEGGEDENKTEDSPYGRVVSEAITAAGIDIDAEKAAFEENGVLSDEGYAKFDEAGFPREMVDAYLSGVKASQSVASNTAEAEVTRIKGLAGGDEGFAKLQQHIAASYSPEQLSAYNEAIGSGDMSKVEAAVQSAISSYQAEVGTEGELLGGKAPEAQTGYKSEAEVMADMRKPEYKKDPAFRAQVEEKLRNSPSVFRTR